MNKIKKSFSLIIMMLCLLGFTLSVNAYGTELTGKTAMEITELMGVGWNLGNTLDANGYSQTDNIYKHETYWGNPQVTETLIKGVKAAGFNTIRIPVTWYTEMDSNYQIKSEFLNRVQQVVDYAIDQDMFVILNVHHEEWINTTSLASNKTNIGKELAAVWTQLASRFADYDQHLIFEGMNEPRYAGADNEWTGDENGFDAVNYLNQIFVNTIRTNAKGYNAERCLMCPQYAASNSRTIMSSWIRPTFNGQSAGNIIVSVHGYSPYNFCLSDEQSTWSENISNDTDDINSMFSSIDKIFISKNIAVVIGETSATNTNDNREARANWAKYMGEMSKSYGVPIVIWDNGVYKASGGESHGWIDRNTGKATESYSAAITNLFLGYNSKTWGSAREDLSSKQSLINQTVLWQKAEGVSLAAWDSASVYIESIVDYYVAGKDLAVVYKGDNELGLVLDSATLEKWWMFVDADKTEIVNGYKVAYFSKESIDKVLNNEGVNSYVYIRNIMVVTKGTDTIYEIAQTGNEPAVTTEFKITTQPNSISVDCGSVAYFSVATSGLNPVYQWQWSYDGVKWYNSGLACAKTSTYTFTTTASDNMLVRCKISNGNETIFTDEVSCTVKLPTIITRQPSSVSVNLGSRAAFTIETSGNNTYQWQWSYDNSNWNNSGIASAKTANYNFVTSQSDNNLYVRCLVKNSSRTEISNVVILSLYNAPQISKQPQSQNVYLSNRASYSVEAYGSNLSYQWQWSYDNKTWHSSGIFSAKTNNYYFNASYSDHNLFVRCLVKNSYGTTISNVAGLTIENAPVIVSQPKNLTVSLNGKVSFSVEATGSNLSYQWQWSYDCSKWNNSGITSAKTNNYNFIASSSDNNLYVRCIVKNSIGSATSGIVKLKVVK